MEQANTLEQALDGIFAGTVTEFTTTTGVQVHFPRAGIVQLGKATKFINLLIERADKIKVDAFLKLVAGEQAALLAEGKSAHDINLNNVKLLGKALDNGPLLMSLFGSMADALPEFVAIFTTIKEDDYAALTLDEQLVIAAGILVVNYSFFTQSLPPIIRSALKGFQMLKSGQGKRNAAMK